MVRSPGHRWKVVWHQNPPSTDVHFIIGFMAAGKTSLAKELAVLWQLPFFDTDQMITEKTGLSIPEIFSQNGEDFFRHLETEILDQFKPETPAVISCGGGLPCFGDNMQRLLSIGTVWWLNVPIQVVLKRLEALNNRPLASSLDSKALLNLYQNRLEFYKQAHAELLEFDGRE